MKSVSFIGSGNVATHLAIGLSNQGICITQIFSNTINNAKILANKVNAQAIDDLVKLDSQNVDIVIIAVKDDVIHQVASTLKLSNTILVHTSGTIPLTTLNSHLNHGVFYPLQTFSKNQNVNLSEVPLCIEANNSKVEKTLVNLANLLSSNVKLVNSETRKAIHLSAVFACNFSNHMLAIADKLLLEANQDLSILAPLIKETIQKALASSPSKVQTGPAKRNDLEVIENHLDRLKEDENIQEIYKNISTSIISWNNE